MAWFRALSAAGLVPKGRRLRALPEELLVSKIIIKINYLISISLAVILFRLSFLGLIFRLWFISVQEIVLE